MIETTKTERFAGSFIRYNRSPALAAQFNEMADEIETIIGYVSEVESDLALCAFEHVTFIQFLARSRKLLSRAKVWIAQNKMINS